MQACIGFGTLAGPMSWGSLLRPKITLLFEALILAIVLHFSELVCSL